MLMEAMVPMRESVPYSENKSRTRPVAAEEENIRTMERGTNGAGKPTSSAGLERRLERKSRNPLARRTPTPTIKPMRVGRMEATVFMPFLAPRTKSS